MPSRRHIPHLASSFILLLVLFLFLPTTALAATTSFTATTDTSQTAEFGFLDQCGGDLFTNAITSQDFVVDTAGSYTIQITDNGENTFIMLYAGHFNAADTTQNCIAPGGALDTITADLNTGTTYIIVLGSTGVVAEETATVEISGPGDIFLDGTPPDDGGDNGNGDDSGDDGGDPNDPPPDPDPPGNPDPPVDPGPGNGDNGSSETTLCHIPPGNPAAAHTITVGAAAVDAHLAHGDHLGPCTGNEGNENPVVPGDVPPGPPPDAGPPPDNGPPEHVVPNNHTIPADPRACPEKPGRANGNRPANVPSCR